VSTSAYVASAPPADTSRAGSCPVAAAAVNRPLSASAAVAAEEAAGCRARARRPSVPRTAASNAVTRSASAAASAGAPNPAAFPEADMEGAIAEEEDASSAAILAS